MISYHKMHSIGNDFIIIDARDEENYTISAEKVRLLAHRNFGIGCDQLATITKAKEHYDDGHVRFYNSDGSESGACGNATRCIAWLLAQGSKREIRIRTNAETLKCLIDGDNVTVQISPPRFMEIDTRPIAEVIMNHDISTPVSITHCDVGNPHCVVFLNENVLEKSLFHKLCDVGRIIENMKSIFPHKTNVEFVNIVDRGLIEVFVWERGTGPTFACGTGAYAAAATGNKNNALEATVLVTMMGTNASQINKSTPKDASLKIQLHKKEGFMSGKVWYIAKLEV
jgi:diaminopimelate epimerase